MSFNLAQIRHSGAIRQIESSGRQLGSSVDFTVRGQITRFVTGIAQYTYSKTLNNTGGISWFPASDQYDEVGRVQGRADFDRKRHRPANPFWRSLRGCAITLRLASV